MPGAGHDGTVGGGVALYARDAGAVLRRGPEGIGNGIRQLVFAGGLPDEALRHEATGEMGGAADEAAVEPLGSA